MRICYIGSFQKLHDEEGIALALEKMGHNVFRYPEDRVDSTDPIIDLNPDIVIFAKLKIPVVMRIQLLDICKELGIKTVCWIPDLFIGLGRQIRIEGKDSIFRADLVCTPDGGHDEVWKEKGINHKLLRQGIPESQVYTGEETPRSYEIVFVGSQNPEFKYRTELTRRLRQKYGDRFHWVGRDYSDECRGKDLNDLYASVKIVVGDSVYSPRYWSNRIYETLGRGGFLIHPNIDGLNEEFEYYRDFVPYDYGDFDALFTKIDYYLTHDDERELIKKIGQDKVRNQYTLTHRCQQLMKYVDTLC